MKLFNVLRFDLGHGDVGTFRFSRPRRWWSMPFSNRDGSGDKPVFACCGLIPHLGVAPAAARQFHDGRGCVIEKPRVKVDVKCEDQFFLGPRGIARQPLNNESGTFQATGYRGIAASEVQWPERTEVWPIIPMRSTNDSLGVISASAANEKIPTRPAKSEAGEEGLPAQLVEFFDRTFYAFGCHIAQGHASHLEIAVTSGPLLWENYQTGQNPEPSYCGSS